MLQAGPLPCSPAHPLHAPPSQAWPFAAHPPDAAFPQPGQNGGQNWGGGCVRRGEGEMEEPIN